MLELDGEGGENAQDADRKKVVQKNAGNGFARLVEGVEEMKKLHALVWLFYLAALATMVLTGGTLKGNYVAFGGVLLAVGAAVILWAKYWLGPQYCRTPQECERLITSGPYKFVRHPEYLGVIIAFLGLALVEGSREGLFVWALGIVPVHVLLGYFEENVLEAALGEEYRAYKHEKGSFAPKLAARRPTAKKR